MAHTNISPHIAHTNWMRWRWRTQFHGSKVNDAIHVNVCACKASPLGVFNVWMLSAIAILHAGFSTMILTEKKKSWNVCDHVPDAHVPFTRQPKRAENAAMCDWCLPDNLTYAHARRCRCLQDTSITNISSRSTVLSTKYNKYIFAILRYGSFELA